MHMHVCTYTHLYIYIYISQHVDHPNINALCLGGGTRCFGRVSVLTGLTGLNCSFFSPMLQFSAYILNLKHSCIVLTVPYIMKTCIKSYKKYPISYQFSPISYTNCKISFKHNHQVIVHACQSVLYLALWSHAQISMFLSGTHGKI